MAGAKTVPEKTEQAIPPHAAGREVLSYVNQQEKEADDAFNAANGLPPEGEPGKEPEKEPIKEPEADPEKEPEKEPAKEPEKEPAPAAPVVDDDDLTKGLNTDNASLRIKAAQTKMHSSNTRANTAEEQRDALELERDDLLKKLEVGPVAPAAAAKPVADAVPSSADAKADDDELKTSMEELNQEYPEIAKPMLKMMAKQELENKKLADQVNTLVEKEQNREVEVAKTEKASHYTTIKEAHSDYLEISNEPLLDEWIEGLPAVERAGARAIRKGGATGDVIDLLTMFKAANGYTAPIVPLDDIPANKGLSKIEKAKKAATPSFNKSKDVNLKTGMVGKFTRRGIGAMTQEEYNAQEPEIDAWMQAGSPE